MVAVGTGASTDEACAKPGNPGRQSIRAVVATTMNGGIECGIYRRVIMKSNLPFHLIRCDFDANQNGAYMEVEE
jgi:hypothetical protein